MIEIAEKIIAQLEGPFEPAEFKDRYEEALRDLIQRKQRGDRPVSAPPPKESNVIDLMDALRKSLRDKPKAAAPRRKSR
jgi:DNA end-binding protein Ku